MRKQHEVLIYGTSRIPYSIQRLPNRDSVSVTVHPTGNVSVKAPKGMRTTRIDTAVRGKARWIVQQQESFRQLQRGFSKQFVSGESFLYLGRQYRLRVRRSRNANAEPELKMFAGRLNVVVPNSVPKESQSISVRESIVRWYRERAMVFLRNACEEASRRLMTDSPVVRIREMAKRWGSCGNAGWVAFNWRIVMAPKRLIEYVAAHEVCHLVHNNHSKEFWRTLEGILPDYEARRLELAITGAKYCI